MNRLGVAAFLLALSLSGSAREPRAALWLHGLFGDGMVLQRDAALPVWGSAETGDTLSVSIAGQTKTAKAGADGRWSLRLDPIPAGGPHELRVEGSTKIVVKDVVVGEVWLAGGGSNMELPLKQAKLAKTEPDEGPIAMLRFFVVPRKKAPEPTRELSGSWITNRSTDVAEVSATAYFFAREIQRQLKVPVGIVQASVEDSPAEQWAPLRSLKGGRMLRGMAVMNALERENYEYVIGMYRSRVQRAVEKGLDPSSIPKPTPPMNPSELYNGMIAPLSPYAIRGAIWYQGEVDCFRPLAYQELFQATIRALREDWKQGDFPFGFVQVANFGARREEPELRSGLADLREAQAKALQLPNTGMATAIDLGDERDSRPRNKEDVARRLALWARSRVYGGNQLYSGPVFQSMKIEQNKVRVTFKNVGGGLKASGDRLTGFQISGDFKRFTWADAKIEGDSVVVSYEGIQWPAAVRYAWEDNPDANLVNQEGFPAIPFRSDNW